MFCVDLYRDVAEHHTKEGPYAVEHQTKEGPTCGNATIIVTSFIIGQNQPTTPDEPVRLRATSQAVRLQYQRQQSTNTRDF